MRRRLWIMSLLFFFLTCSLFLGRVYAAEGQQGDECLVAGDDVIETDFFVACNVLIVEGVIEGDLIGGAWSTVIRPGARIEGDIWLLGGQLVIEGTVEDDVHFAGVDLDVTETAQLTPAPDVIAAALNTEIWEGATVPGDLIMFGYQAIVRGEVNKDVNFNGSALVIEGQVDGDVYAEVGNGDAAVLPFPLPFSVSLQTPGLTVRSEGQINGDLAYTGEQPGNVSGRIGGEIDFSRIIPRPDITQTEESPGNVIAGYLNAVLTDVLSLMMAGILVLLISPGWLHKPAMLIPYHLPSSLGWGLILTPLIAAASLIMPLVSLVVLVFLSLVTLGGFTTMGLALLFVFNIAVIGGLTFLVFFVARLVFSMLIGRVLGERMIQANDRWAVNVLPLLIGVIVYALIVNIPVPQIGQIIYWVSIFIGLGAIVIRLRQFYRSYGSSARPKGRPSLAMLRSSAIQPTFPDRPHTGENDLPPGFNWWQE